MRRLLAVVVVVLAGCAAGVGDGGRQTDAERTASAPWVNGTATVSVRAPDGQRERYRNLTKRGLAYWEANDQRYVGHDVSFRLADSTNGTDVVVTYVESVGGCGHGDEIAGCAPRFEGNGTVPTPVEVEVKRGFDDASTVHVVKHEFGHVLGLDHRSEPRDVMASMSELTTLPRPNATERRLPWNDSTFAVYVDRSGERNWTAVNEQLDATFGYFERGAEGTVPENVTFRRVDDESAADLVISFGRTTDCPQRGACSSVTGVDPDGDTAYERYTRQHVTLVDIETEAVGWYVGYWLTVSFGLDEASERPRALRGETGYQYRRSDWWETGPSDSESDGDGSTG